MVSPTALPWMQLHDHGVEKALLYRSLLCGAGLALLAGSKEK